MVDDDWRLSRVSGFKNVDKAHGKDLFTIAPGCWCWNMADIFKTGPWYGGPPALRNYHVWNRNPQQGWNCCWLQFVRWPPGNFYRWPSECKPDFPYPYLEMAMLVSGRVMRGRIDLQHMWLPCETKTSNIAMIKGDAWSWLEVTCSICLVWRAGSTYNWRQKFEQTKHQPFSTNHHFQPIIMDQRIPSINQASTNSSIIFNHFQNH